MTTDLSQRPRRLASFTGAHLPYLDRLPATETIHFAHAGLALIISAASAGFGWWFVVAWTTAATPGLGFVVPSAAALFAAVVVAALDRELISGSGTLALRAAVGVVNAILIGEIVLLVLFGSFVADLVQAHRDDTYSAVVERIDDDYRQTVEQIAAAEAELTRFVSADLNRLRAELGAVDDDIAELELARRDLHQRRTAEATGQLLFDTQGRALTTGVAGDTGVATASLDLEISQLSSDLDRAVHRRETIAAEIASARVRDEEMRQQSGPVLDQLAQDRVLAVQTRDRDLGAARDELTAAAGPLLRIDLFHKAVWNDAVLASAVVLVHVVLLATELSVVIWAVADRRRPRRPYHDLALRIDAEAATKIPSIASELLATAIPEQSPPSTPATSPAGNFPNRLRVLNATSLRPSGQRLNPASHTVRDATTRAGGVRGLSFASGESGEVVGVISTFGSHGDLSSVSG